MERIEQSSTNNNRKKQQNQTKLNEQNEFQKLKGQWIEWNDSIE